VTELAALPAMSDARSRWIRGRCMGGARWGAEGSNRATWQRPLGLPQVRIRRGEDRDNVPADC
jgi:hypothetical protein